MKYAYFADVYGAGNYGTCTYNSAGTCTSTSTGGGTSTGSGSGSLVNTGVAIAGVVTLACVIIFVSLIVRVWKRKSNQSAVVERVEDDEDATGTDDEQRRD